MCWPEHGYMDVPRTRRELPVWKMVGAGEPESRCQAGVTGHSMAGPQQQLPSSSQASLKPNLSSELILLIVLADAYLSPGASFWLKLLELLSFVSQKGLWGFAARSQ